MASPRPRRPVTAEDFDQVRELHAQHLSRNEIAKRLGRSGRTVSRIAADLGLSFDRANDPHLRKATEARKADARARRAALAVALLEDAERLRQQIFAPVVVYSFGGRENNFAEAQASRPSPRDVRDLMTAVGIAIDRSIKLEQLDADTGTTGARALLVDLGRALGLAATQLDQ